MKILALTPQLPFPPRQGTTIRNFNLIRELAKRHTVDLLTFLAPGEELDPDNPLHELCGSIRTAPQPSRSLSHRGRETLTRALPDMGLRLESEAMRALTVATIAAGGYHVVQTEGIEMAQYGALARATAHMPRPRWVFDNHNCEYLLQKRSAFTDLQRPSRWLAAAYSLVQWRKLVRYEARICASADAVVAVSDADAQALAALVPGLEVAVVSNGIDLDQYAYVGAGPLRPQPALLFTGKMDYRPNIDAALWFSQQVMPLLAAEAPTARFQIVGMNPHPRLDPLRKVPAIEITGTVPAIFPYLHSAAVYVIPMRVGGGTRFKALEAMAAGKPIVSTSLGVEGIPVRHGVELMIADTPAAFAAAVVGLLADDVAAAEQRRRLGENARRFVEQHYGWAQIMPRLERVYARAL